jgi:hypothetical protein
MDKSIYNLIWPLIPICISLGFLYKRKQLLKKGYVVEGEIIELRKEGEDIYPVIHFVTITGETIIKKYKVSQGKEVKTGDKVTLSYNPNDLSKFIINSPAEKWAPMIILVAAVIFQIIQVIIFLSK